MMTFPLDGNSVFVVIEPGNLERLKQGKPLRIGENVLIAYVPDMAHFAKLLGVSGEIPSKGTQIRYETRISAEQIDAALKLCRDRKEVVR